MSQDGLLFDRVPPQNIEAEQSVLGAVLLQAEALITAMERLRQEDFYQSGHQRIFEAMVELGEGNQPIDLVTLTAYLRIGSCWMRSAASAIWPSWPLWCRQQPMWSTTRRL